jgi:ring-1,2-phenylacetyl-CoA epoxidase subunit PaaC
MPTTSIRVTETPRVLYALRHADDALILGHRLSEWCGHGPILEEEMALANFALDLIGQARSLYEYAATAEAAGNDEDKFAYRRDAPQYRNLLLVEQPNGDFAHTMVRQLFYSAYADPYWQAMTRSADPVLAAIAERSAKETAYHLRHASEWVIRLGDGTAESRRRAQAAVDTLWAYTGELFEVDEAERELIVENIATDSAKLRAPWTHTVNVVLAQATLSHPDGTWMQTGGRVGRHSEHLGHLLSTMQHLQRTHPEAAW